jgi:hypothetical protein
MAQSRSTMACLLGPAPVQPQAAPTRPRPDTGIGPGNGTGVTQGQGNATYDSTQCGVPGRHGRDGRTVKDLVAMPQGRKT